MNAEQKTAKADKLEAQATKLRDEASELRHADLLAKPRLERMVFAAAARCQCGAGMAYDRTAQGDAPFKGPSKWECSDIVRYPDYSPEQKAEVKAKVHSSPLPFAFYEVKSENQPSANGATTRPAD